jgi:RHS repeat-associated protein
MFSPGEFSVEGDQLKMDTTTKFWSKYHTSSAMRFAIRVYDGGDVVSATTYTAFGEVRKETGTSPTDYTESKRSFDFKVKTVTVFTHTHGQRSYMDELGLMYYVARWYDPYLNQFIQPDSLIPQPGNSGDWDRYAYVLWNPIKYTDSTGHWIDPFDPDMPGTPESRGVSELRTHSLALAAHEVAIETALNTGDVVEGWAATSDFVALRTHDTDEYMAVMDRIFGHEGNGLPTETTSRDCLMCGILDQNGNLNTDLRPTNYYEQYTVNNDSPYRYSSEGFFDRYADPVGGNQVQHTYYYVQLGYYHNQATAQLGNTWHEIFEGRKNIQDFLRDDPGKSIQDFRAGNVGAQLGSSLYTGFISPRDTGDWIRRYLGKNQIQ